MAIAFVSAATPYSNSGTPGTSFTLNKPTVSAGDLMVAFVAGWPVSGQKTITATGWTVGKTAFRQVGSDYVQVTMLWRVAEAGDPSSWTAAASGNVALRAAHVVAYSGVQSVGTTSTTSGVGSAGNGSSFSTAGLNVTTAGTWMVVAGAYFSGSASYNIACSSPSTRRGSFATSDSGEGAVQGAMFDTGSLSVANGQTRTVSRSANWTCAAAVNVLLTPTTGTPATGDVSGSLASVEATAAGEVFVSGPLAGSMPPMTSTAEGYGQPPVVTGTASASMQPLQSTLVGGQAVSGSLTAPLALSAGFEGETRKFGVRTIVVEPDDRVIEVESRAVAD